MSAVFFAERRRGRKSNRQPKLLKEEGNNEERGYSARFLLQLCGQSLISSCQSWMLFWFWFVLPCIHILQSLVPFLLQTHNSLAFSQSVCPKSGSITKILKICPSDLRSPLISSTEHQFPGRQTCLNGETSQYWQQENTGKSLCTASDGQMV